MASWALLALLFYIPGVYLEWPSDPWEHLRRINEWHVHDIITAHSAWKKSSYFLPYSLTGHTTGLVQLDWLNFYYTGVCLLLSWQYHRLARTIGLGDRAAFIFVLLNAFTLGNSVFSFYRYYGLSSSILAQIGAVALTRVALDTSGAFGRLSRTAAFKPRWYSLLGATLGLLSLVVFNHIQGIGIAGLCILAVLVWRLLEWKRACLVWLVGVAVILSIATVLWFPRHPALDGIYRPQGWLTAWYSLNLFSFASPPFTRSLQIIGVLGVASLACGLWLVWRRNHVAGWLTVMPLVALCFPCFALPLAHFVTADNPAEDILIFSRLLLAIPVALAPLVAISYLRRALWSPTLGYVSLFAALLLAVTLSPGGPVSYNRFWHGTQAGPSDLNLRSLISTWERAQPADASADDTLVIAPPLGNRGREAFVPQREWWQWRQIHAPLGAAEVKRPLGWVHALPALDASMQFLSATGEAVFRVPSQTPREVIDLSTPRTAWSNDASRPPELSASAGGLVVSNPLGAASQAFARQLIPLAQGKRYQLTVTVQQSGDPDAVNYLAVAWHGSSGDRLEASQATPDGAGNPLGWTNGAYSYFGLVAEPTPADWTTYSISFGLGEAAEIPPNAAFLRIGALLNYRESVRAKVRLAKVQLCERPLPARVIFFAPDFVTPASLAAQLSGHWNPAKAHLDYAGTAELRAAVKRQIIPRDR